MALYFPATAQAVLKNGYPICAIAPHGKGPRYRGWQEKSLTAEQCQEPRFADNGIGILCGMEPNLLIGIDADITDEALANAVFSRWIKDVPALAEATRRWGARPKFLLMVRFEHSRTKEKFGCYVKAGKKAEVEILGKGQQFCALHIHPGTGKPYTWEDPTGEVFGFIGSGCYGDPSTRPLEALPLLTEVDLTLLQQGYREECEKAGYSSFNEGSESRVVEDEQLARLLIPPKPPIPGIDLEKAEALIKDCKFNLGSGSYDTWLKLGMALHHQFAGAPEALALWDRLSAQFPEAYTEGACAKRWGGFKDDKPDTVTFGWVQKTLQERGGDLVNHLSVAGLYYRTLRDYGRVLAWDYQNKNWLYFQEGTWHNKNGQAFVAEAIKHVINNTLGQEIAREIRPDYQQAISKFKEKCLQKLDVNIRAVTYLLSTTGALTVCTSDFDMDPRYFGVNQGVIDLDTGSYLPGRPEMHVLRHSKVIPDAGAKCPLWEQSVLEWLTPPCSDTRSREDCLKEGREKAAFMKRALGSALTGQPVDDKFLLLVGNGSNGKSVFINTLYNFFGEDGVNEGYAESLNSNTLMGGDKVTDAGKARADVAKLCGSRFVLCSETSNVGNITLKEAEVKRMTGRDPITARGLYAVKEVTFFPTWLMFVATNDSPVIRGDDDGIWRRICEVDFLRKIDEDPYLKEDKLLQQKLQKEFPGILNWMLEGLEEYRRCGLQIPESIKQQVSEYRSNQDLIAGWLKSCVKVDKKKQAARKEYVTNRSLYASYSAYLKEEGADRISYITCAAFTRRLNRKINALDRTRIAGAWRYYGYRLRSADDDAEQELLS